MWFMNFSCVAAMLRSTLADGLITQRAALKYIGERFRLKAELPEWTSDEDVARYLLKYVGLPHQRELVSNLIPPTPTTHPHPPHPQPLTSTPLTPASHFPSSPPLHLAFVTYSLSLAVKMEKWVRGPLDMRGPLGMRGAPGYDIDLHLNVVVCYIGHTYNSSSFSLFIQGSSASASMEECRQVQPTHVSFPECSW